MHQMTRRSKFGEKRVSGSYVSKRKWIDIQLDQYRYLFEKKRKDKDNEEG